MSGRAPRSAETTRLLDRAAELAACERDEDMPAPLGAIRSLVGADAIGCGEIRRRGNGEPPRLEFGPGSDAEIYEPVVIPALARHWRQNPTIVQHLCRPLAAASKTTDFLTASQWRRRALYRDGYGAAGLRYEIAVQLSWDHDGTAGLALHRARRDFGERERSLLTRLRPHLRAARGRIEAGREAQRRLALLEAGLEQGGIATALVDGGGRILAASDGCLPLLGRWFDPSRRPDELPPELLAWQGRQRRRADPAPLRRVVADRTLEVTASSVEDGSLLMLRERRVDHPDPAALAAALPLTGRQAQVLALVCRGRGDAAIAHELDISVRTVGHHVQHILKRLEVPSRTAAATLALGVG